jgi:hypothetical protein
MKHPFRVNFESMRGKKSVLSTLICELQGRVKSITLDRHESPAEFAPATAGWGRFTAKNIAVAPSLLVSRHGSDQTESQPDTDRFCAPGGALEFFLDACKAGKTGPSASQATMIRRTPAYAERGQGKGIPFSMPCYFPSNVMDWS